MSDNILDPRELRGLDSGDLTRQLGEFKQELFNLRFQHHTGQLENHMRINHVKRNIARIHTVLREREIVAEHVQTDAPAEENEGLDTGE